MGDFEFGNVVEAASREQQIAIALMEDNDFAGAKDKLVKAQNYYPELENLIEMMAVCDILCSGKIVSPGCGTDWYWVLQINQEADEFEIESKYQRLTHLLESVKSTFPGTVLALKLVEDAYSVLSDKQKRFEFNKRRASGWNSSSTLKLIGPSHLEINYKEKEATSGSSFGSKKNVSECSDRSNKVNNSRDTEALKNHEIVNKLVNEICFQEVSSVSACKKSSAAGAERSLTSSSGNPLVPTKTTAYKICDRDVYDFDRTRKAEVFAVGHIWAAYDQEKMPRRYARINGIENTPFKLIVTWLKPSPVNEDEKRWHEVGLPISCGYFKLDAFELDRCNGVLDGLPVFSHLVSQVQGSINEPEIYPQKGQVWAIYKDWQPFKWCSDPETKKGCTYQIVEILEEYHKNLGVKVAGLVKVAGFKRIFRRHNEKGNEFSFQISAAKLFIFSHHVPAFRFNGGEMDFISDGMLELDSLSVPENLGSETVSTKPPLIGRDNYSSKQHISRSPPVTSEQKSISSKPKWACEDFASGQVWALYDKPDSMPRRYARVNNLVSRSDVCVTYFEPTPLLKDEIHWVEEGLPYVSGLFRIGRTTVNLEMPRFSHLVDCESSRDSDFHKIYPKKGEVWAIYKNWSTKWKKCNLDSYDYQVVEILSDFSEEMRVISLVEVKGQKTFFQRQLQDGFTLTREIPKEENLSFSHQIPAFDVPGIERHGIPEGSLHLEPDALPPKFINN